MPGSASSWTFDRVRATTRQWTSTASCSYFGTTPSRSGSLKGHLGPPGPPKPAGANADLTAFFGTSTGFDAPAVRECIVGDVWRSAAQYDGGLVAEGRLLSISQNTALLALLGAEYRSDGPALHFDHATT